MSKTTLEIFWNYDGSFKVDVPSNKVEDFKNNWRGWINGPLVPECNCYQTDFEKSLEKNYDGEFVEWNTSWSGNVEDIEEDV